MSKSDPLEQMLDDRSETAHLIEQIELLVCDLCEKTNKNVVQDICNMLHGIYAVSMDQS